MTLESGQWIVHVDCLLIVVFCSYLLSTVNYIVFTLYCMLSTASFLLSAVCYPLYTGHGLNSSFLYTTRYLLSIASVTYPTWIQLNWSQSIVLSIIQCLYINHMYTVGIHCLSQSWSVGQWTPFKYLHSTVLSSYRQYLQPSFHSCSFTTSRNPMFVRCPVSFVVPLLQSTNEFTVSHKFK